MMHEDSAHLQAEFIKDPGSIALHDDRGNPNTGIAMDEVLGKQKTKKYKLDRAEKHIRASIHQFNATMQKEVAIQLSP